ncbi:hypothetical protein BCR37DRAFT_391106 [Protomyces lactucae-debilis]|uniref:Uncharacterized protein n=1 Tax=Protomyces lactucae-debilis TaxID=2754530 RepID=A0A1Y2FQP0_PROLT|nr:uncharacterized protein BCR37DRAFT_391106 [Protomyces lactucae-debilis]ORY86313.1 hypothetical protein BCR37DRAFT_391106 [Protomyces lactucae-debilis]
MSATTHETEDSHSSSAMAPSSPASSTSTQLPVIPAKSYRRAGYLKPAAPAPFAASARARDSVMSLKGIDHLQHYFARAKTARQLQHRAGGPRLPPGQVGRPLQGMCADERALRELHEDGDVDILEEAKETPLPPSPILHSYGRSVSGDVDPRRRRAVLHDQTSLASRAIANIDQSQLDPAAWQEMESRVTSCVRAARHYATAMPTHQLDVMSAGQRHIFGEGAIRVMTCLSLLARNHQLDSAEMGEVQAWVAQIDAFMEQEDAQSQARAALAWLSTPSAPTESQEEVWQRHHAFLVFHDLVSPPLTSPLVDQQRFLMELRTGLRLCLIFNHFVHSSTKPFGEIKQWHTDTSIQWRVTDNLTWWRSAIAYRLGIETDLDPKRVYAFDHEGQAQLQRAVSAFCERAIAEVIQSLPDNDTSVKLDAEIERLQL